MHAWLILFVTPPGISCGGHQLRREPVRPVHICPDVADFDWRKRCEQRLEPVLIKRIDVTVGRIYSAAVVACELAYASILPKWHANEDIATGDPADFCCSPRHVWHVLQDFGAKDAVECIVCKWQICNARSRDDYPWSDDSLWLEINGDDEFEPLGQNLRVIAVTETNFQDIPPLRGRRRTRSSPRNRSLSDCR